MLAAFQRSDDNLYKTSDFSTSVGSSLGYQESTICSEMIAP